MKSIFILFFLFYVTIAFAQTPSNDACVNAQAVALPVSGVTCLNSTNLNATSDNSTNACDVGTAGNEVWFTYVATGANNVITVTPNGTTPASGLVLTLITSGCAGGTYDVCNSATGTASVSSTLGLAPGTVVLISVETNGTDGTFQLCISSTPPAASPGNTCAQASLVCNKASMDFPNLSGFTASGTQPSCFGAAVRKDVWIKFTVGVTGILEFTGTPLAADEYDWALYNVTAGCLGTQVGCNYNYASAGPFSCGTPGATFGMLGNTAGQPCPGEFAAPITVTAGQTYALLIDNYNQTNNGFTLDWGGTFQMGTTAIFTVTPQSSCTVPVTVNITNGSVGATTYTWNYGDGSTSTTNNATHTYTTTGDYLISLVANGGGCTSVYSQRVNLNTGPVISISPLTSTICPPSSANLGGIISLGTPYNDHNYTNNPNTTITNNTPTGITNTITSTGMLSTTLATGMVQSICFTINHTKHSDIGNDLIGNNVTITVNGNTYNFTPLPLTGTSGTATYCFPQSVLNAIMAAGGNSNTNWILKIADTRGGGGGSGSLISWTVVLRDPNSVTGYTWSPTSTMTNSNTLSPTVSPTTTTVYSLTATDKFGCTSTKTTTVIISCSCPTLTALNYGGSVCKTSTVTLTPTVTGVGAISSGSYSSTPTGLSMSATTGIITPSLSTANTYTVTYLVTPSSGTCMAVSVNTVITIKPTPTIAVTNTSVCEGSSITITAGGASTYTWSTGATTSSIAVTPTVATVYTVTGTNSLSCVNSNTVSVSINPIPTTTATTSGTLTCSTTTVALNSNISGMTYTWSAPAGGTVGSSNSHSTTASGAAGNYTVIIKSSAGCTFTTTTNVTQNTAAPTTTASTTGTLTCTTNTVTLNSTSAGMNYTWTAPPGGSIGSINTQSTIASGAIGIYTIVIQNPLNGCVYTTTTSVGQNTVAPTGVNAGSSQSLTCASTSVTLNGSVTTPTNSTANWTGPNVCGTATNFTTSACGAGIYTLTATSPVNGCTATSTVQVFPSAGAPSVTLNPVTNSITCTNSLVTVSISSTVSPASYTWSGVGIVSGNGTPTITVNQGGSFNFTLTNTTNSCSTSNNLTVIQNTTIPTTTASTTGTLTCSATSVSLTSTLAGMNYTWTAPAGGSLASINSQSTAASGAAGTYTIKVVNPANGCTYSTTTAVTQNTTVPTTTASTTGTLTCTTLTVALNSTLGGMNYTWTAPPGGSVASSNSQSTSASGVAGTYTVKVVNPTNGCTYSTTTAVSQNTITPTTTASSTGSLTCSTTTVALNSTLAGMTYTWSAPSGGGVSSVNTQSTSASGAGIYTLSVVNPANGCSYSTTTAVIQNTTVPTTTASTTGTLTCTTSTVALNSTLAGMNYTWTAPTGGSLGSSNSQSTTASGISGTYSLLVVNPSTGCTFATTTSVTHNSVIPTTIASTTGTLTCSSTSVTLNSTLAGMNYTWTAPSGASLGTVNSQSTTASGVAGTYTITVIDPANGCTYSTTTSVSQNTTVPTTTASTTGTLTCATASVTLNSTLAGMNYTWTSPAGGSLGTVNSQSTTASGAAGTYTINVVDPANGCIYSTTTSVSQNTVVPTTTASTTGTLTCATTSVTLNSSLVGMNYTWTAPAGGSVSNANSQSSTGSGAPGTYSLTVSNPANGCSYNTTTTVTQNTTVPTGVSAGTNQTLTCATPSIALNGSVTSPTNPTVNWTGPNVCGTATSLTTSVCGAGVYTLTATNPINGCISSSTVMVSPSAGAPSVTLNPVTNTITCTNTLVTVSISSTVSPATYTWSGSGIVSGNGTPTITVNQGGTFNFTLTNTTNSCTTSNNLSVAQNITVPTTSISTTGSLTCLATSTVTLNASLTGMNYTWTAPSGGNISNSNTQSTSVSGSPGVYTVTVQNPANGCVYTTTTSVNQNTTTPTGVNAGSNQTLTCNSASVSLNGSVSSPTNATANWSGPFVCGSTTSFSTSACAPGLYTLTATDPINGCVASSTMQVFPVSGAPAVTVNPVTNSITCTNTLVTISLSSTVTPITYSWSGTGIIGSTNSPSITVNQGGTFAFTVTNSGGCSTVGTQTVAQNTTAPLTTASTTGTLTCSAATVALNSTLAGMNYTWTAPSGGILGSANSQSTSASGNPGTYSLTVLDPSNGCTYTTSTSVTQNTITPLTSTSTSGTLTCSVTTVSLNSTLTGMNYTWTAPPGGNIGSSFTQSTSASGSAGVYTLTVMNPSNGCSYSTTTSVTQNTIIPVTTVSVNGTITCTTPTVVLNSSTTGMNYTWTAPPGGTLGNSNAQSTNAFGSGGTYSLTITNPSNGCSYATSANVTEDILAPTVTISGTQTITCLTTTATLNATGGGTYNWSGPGILTGGNTSSPTVNMPGIYSVSVSSSNGCITTKTTSVIKNTPTPTITITSSQTLTCLITTVTISATGGGTYVWSGPGIVSGSNSASPSVNLPGNYNVTVTAANGCTATASGAVSQNTTMPSLTISSNTVINPGQQAQLNISGSNTSYTWSPGDGLSCTTCSNPIASPEVSTEYCVSTSEGICLNVACVLVNVEIDCENNRKYDTPNAFSPNGDGNNDEFCLQGWKGCLSQFYVAIFNRWGNKVFESTEADFCWDGMYLGKLLDPAVFVFYIKAETIQGEKIERKGNITLIK